MITVWNISDHPNGKTQPKTIHMFGKEVLPGACVRVPEARAAAVKAMVGSLPVFVGDKLPADYLYAKGVYRTELPRGTRRAHGLLVETAAPAVVPPVSPPELPRELKPVIRRGRRRRSSEGK